MIKGCNSTLPQAFLQNGFSDQPISKKKSYKAFVKLHANKYYGLVNLVQHA